MKTMKDRKRVTAQGGRWVWTVDLIARLKAADPVCETVTDIAVHMGLEPTVKTIDRIYERRRRLGMAKKPLRAPVQRRQRQHEDSVPLTVISDWLDMANVARDMGGRRFEDVTFRTVKADPVFMPARYSEHSAGVADYSGAR